MIEPTDPAERLAAIKICRVNAFLNPGDGSPMSDPKEATRLWNDLPDVPYKKWIWMWNHGQAEWDPTHADTDGEPRVR